MLDHAFWFWPAGSSWGPTYMPSTMIMKYADAILLKNHQCSTTSNFCNCKHYKAGYHWSALFNYKTTTYIQRYLRNGTECIGNLSDVKIYFETAEFLAVSQKQKQKRQTHTGSKEMFPEVFLDRVEMLIIVFGIYCQWSHLLLSLCQKVVGKIVSTPPLE